MPLPALFSHPVVRAVGTQVLTVLAQSLVSKMLLGEPKDLREEATKAYIDRIDRLSRELSERKAEHQGEQVQVGELNMDTRNVEDHGEENKPHIDAENDEDKADQPYSRYAPDMRVSTACLPCTRAHLAMVAGSLEEALRFAREDGVSHPEVVKRLGACGKDLVVLERYDLAPEKISALLPEEKAVVQEILPRIRKLRQQVLNQIDDVESLERVAAEAEQLYWVTLQKSPKGDEIDWQRVERELFGVGQEQEAGAEAVESPEQPPSVASPKDEAA